MFGLHSFDYEEIVVLQSNPGLNKLHRVFQACESVFKAHCLLGVNLGQKGDRNELKDIIDIVNSWYPLEERSKRGKFRRALTDLETIGVISSEEAQFGKGEKRFYQITNLGRAILIYLLSETGYLLEINPSTLQKSWENVDITLSLDEILFYTLKKLKPYNSLLEAIKSRSGSLPTTTKKHFMIWKPDKIFGVKTPDYLNILEILIVEQTKIGVGVTSAELDKQLPEITRPSTKIKKLSLLVEIVTLDGEKITINRLNSIGLNCLYPLGMLLVSFDGEEGKMDPRPLLLPPTDEILSYQHLMKNAINFFRTLLSSSF